MFINGNQWSSMVVFMFVDYEVKKMHELKTDMTLKEVHAFINDLWQELIKPTWERDMTDHDWETVVHVAGELLPEKHGDSALLCTMVNAYLKALEIKDKERRRQEEK